MFSTWSYESNQPLALEALRDTMRKLPGSVYRAKGVIYTTDAPNRRAVLQVVGRRVDISLQEEWGHCAPRTQIVAIGAAGSIDARLLEETVASCIPAPVGRESMSPLSKVFEINPKGLNVKAALVILLVLGVPLIVMEAVGWSVYWVNLALAALFVGIAVIVMLLVTQLQKRSAAKATPQAA